jgi:hypothetical protein
MKKIIYILLILITTTKIFCGEKYVLYCDSRLLELSEQIAYKQVGVTELTNKNDGPEVEKYLKSVGLGKGFPYCKAGQYYCYAEANKEIKTKIPFPKSALANKVFDVAKTKNEKTNYQPERHDFIVWRTPKKSTGHIERIVEVKSGGWVKTIAFNTTSGNFGNQRDGGGVYIRKRNILHPLGQMKIRGLVGFKQI